MTSDLTFKLGTRVAYQPDPRVTGVIVGFGSVDNAADSQASDSNQYDVAIVRLDEPSRIPPGTTLSFHLPCMLSVLTVIT